MSELRTKNCFEFSLLQVRQHCLRWKGSQGKPVMTSFAGLAASIDLVWPPVFAYHSRDPVLRSQPAWEKAGKKLGVDVAPTAESCSDVRPFEISIGSLHSSIINILELPTQCRSKNIWSKDVPNHQPNPNYFVKSHSCWINHIPMFVGERIFQNPSSLVIP